jgi:hypothetical protein
VRAASIASVAADSEEKSLCPCEEPENEHIIEHAPRLILYPKRVTRGRATAESIAAEPIRPIAEVSERTPETRTPRAPETAPPTTGTSEDAAYLAARRPRLSPAADSTDETESEPRRITQTPPEISINAFFIPFATPDPIPIPSIEPIIAKANISSAAKSIPPETNFETMERVIPSPDAAAEDAVTPALRERAAQTVGITQDADIGGTLFQEG